MERCRINKIGSIHLPALSHFGADRNSLRSKGINNENIDRTYQCLFVYSLGFNQFLNSLCANLSVTDGMNVRKTVWVIFANLL